MSSTLSNSAKHWLWVTPCSSAPAATAISRDDLDQHGLIVGVSPERLRAMAMPLLFDHLNAQCEDTIAVNRQARIVWSNDKYAAKVGISDPRSLLGQEIEQVLPASRLREVVESGQPSRLDLTASGSEHFVVTRIPLRDEDGTLVGALGFVLFDCASLYSKQQQHGLSARSDPWCARRTLPRRPPGLARGPVTLGRALFHKRSCLAGCMGCPMSRR